MASASCPSRYCSAATRPSSRPWRRQTTRHVAEEAPFASPFLEGAKSVQLADACYQSSRERRWIDFAGVNDLIPL
jgi:hypothetical protein